MCVVVIFQFLLFDLLLFATVLLVIQKRDFKFKLIFGVLL